MYHECNCIHDQLQAQNHQHSAFDLVVLITKLSIATQTIYCFDFIGCEIGVELVNGEWMGFSGKDKIHIAEGTRVIK